MLGPRYLLEIDRGSGLAAIGRFRFILVLYCLRLVFESLQPSSPSKAGILVPDCLPWEPQNWVLFYLAVFS